eukprot:COSAG01_NODE_3152_length_6498_cov_17.406470_3_plen_786_part_00
MLRHPLSYAEPEPEEGPQPDDDSPPRHTVFMTHSNEVSTRLGTLSRGDALTLAPFRTTRGGRGGRAVARVMVVVWWVCVGVIHTLTGLGLVFALQHLFFGRAEAECDGPVLTSCADSDSWRWVLGFGTPAGCASFAETVAGNATSLHEFCETAKSVSGEAATEACKTACNSCGLSWGIEFVIAGAPILARNALIGAVVMTGCSKVSGFVRRTGLLANLLVGPSSANLPGAPANVPSGWAAIAGVRGGDPEEQPQATWAETCESRALTNRQALASALSKLLMWHWSQPLAYLTVLWGYRCYVAALGETQRRLAAVVAAREVVYLASTLLGVCACPVFLLLDPVAAWKEADTKLEKCIRVAMYVLTPHNYVAFCLGNRFRGCRRLFLGVAAIQVAADLASCFALGALMAGGIEEEEKKPPSALKIGYIMTAFGFLLFFGPLSVATSLRSAFDTRQQCWRRISGGVGGSLLLLALTSIVVIFALLAAEIDVFCRASTIGILGDPCNGHGTCYAAAQCHCDEGYGPEVSYDGQALCACAGASKREGCGEHGICLAAEGGSGGGASDLPQHLCDCYEGYSGSQCGRGTGCDGDPCGSHGSCTPDGGNYSCVCASGWGACSCDHPTGCDDQPCLNGGTCTANGGQYTCHCAEGWIGTQCDRATGCDSHPCHNSGTCMANAGEHHCQCASGWSGEQDCDHATGCDDHPCLNSGTCTANAGEHHCQCASGWSGEQDCDHATGCDDQPCLNDGTCTANAGEHHCQCASGWSGEQDCAHPTGCDGNPCGNHRPCR